MAHLSMLHPTGADRVREHTSPSVNERIDRETTSRLTEASGLPPIEIGRRMAVLEREWDIDRALMAFLSLLAGAALVVGLTRRPLRRVWFAPVVPTLGSLFLHSLAGWCPPAALFRRLGFRSQPEIHWERHLLECEIEPAPQTERQPGELPETPVH